MNADDTKRPSAGPGLGRLLNWALLVALAVGVIWQQVRIGALEETTRALANQRRGGGDGKK